MRRSVETRYVCWIVRHPFIFRQEGIFILNVVLCHYKELNISRVCRYKACRLNVVKFVI